MLRSFLSPPQLALWVHVRIPKPLVGEIRYSKSLLSHCVAYTWRHVMFGQVTVHGKKMSKVPCTCPTSLGYGKQIACFTCGRYIESETYFI